MDARLHGLILGIDPGLAATGLAVLAGDGSVVACRSVKTAPGPAGPRLIRIVDGVRETLAAHTIVEASLEELFMGRNSSSAIGVAQARGAILWTLEDAGIPVWEYKPSQVKSVLTGYGMAPKAQMARMLEVQVAGLGRLDDHAIDAVAIAICHSRSRRIRTAVAAARG